MIEILLYIGIGFIIGVFLGNILLFLPTPREVAVFSLVVILLWPLILAIVIPCLIYTLITGKDVG